VKKQNVESLRRLTAAVRQDCDTFYSIPGFAILYFYTQLPEPTGQLANFPGVLSVREQRDIASELRTLERRGRRVCIVRNDHTFPTWKHSSYATGPLGQAVAPFRRRVARVGEYTLLRYGSPVRGRFVQPDAEAKKHRVL
jgi:hypothetical protein